MNTATEKQRKALGKGLSSLLPSRSAPVAPALPSPEREQNPATLPLQAIQPNPTQPRTVFDNEALQELATSIRAHGIIQPLIVRRHGDSYQIVAGERRWRVNFSDSSE